MISNRKTGSSAIPASRRFRHHRNASRSRRTLRIIRLQARAQDRTNRPVSQTPARFPLGGRQDVKRRFEAYRHRMISEAASVTQIVRRERQTAPARNSHDLGENHPASAWARTSTRLISVEHGFDRTNVVVGAKIHDLGENAPVPLGSPSPSSAHQTYFGCQLRPDTSFARHAGHAEFAVRYHAFASATAHTSRLATVSAFSWMNSRRGSTSSPISAREQRVGVGRVVDPDLQQRARVRVERRFPELLGVHLAQALVALHREALAAGGEDRVEQRAAGRRSSRTLSLRRQHRRRRDRSRRGAPRSGRARAHRPS